MYYSVSHLQPVVESDELFHPILPSVRINMLVIMKKSNLTCACQATMSSHSMGSPSDSSPILLHFLTSWPSKPATLSEPSVDSGPVVPEPVVVSCGNAGV